jgi:hypothetical protein
MGTTRSTLAGLLVALVTPLGAGAAVTAFPLDLAGFNAAAGTPPVVVDFDDILPGTDIGGQVLGGVRFDPSATGAPLIVVRASDTLTPAAGFTGIVDASTNTLPATSGAHVLSPGGATLGPGPDDTVENDDLVLTFPTPVSAVGFDHLSQSADGFGFSNVTVFDASSNVLFSGSIQISNLGGGGAPAGADFWGIVSDANDIARIEVDEGDSNNSFPDANIGFDTVRIAGLPTITTTTQVPATTTTTLAGCLGVPDGPTFASVICRLEALLGRVNAESRLGAFGPKLAHTLTKGRDRATDARTLCAAGNAKKPKTRLKQVGRALIQYVHRLAGLPARKKLDDGLRRELLGAGKSIEPDVGTLRKNLHCPADAGS